LLNLKSIGLNVLPQALLFLGPVNDLVLEVGLLSGCPPDASNELPYEVKRKGESGSCGYL
jgi:hypothetical protein